MIGWYCDIGFSETLTSNLSNVTWTDTNRIFSVQEASSSIASITQQGSGDEIYNILKSIIGNGVDAYYSPAIAYSGHDDLLDALTLYLPSAKIGCPNLYSLLKDKSSGYTYIFIPTLKRIIVGFYNSTFGAVIRIGVASSISSTVVWKSSSNLGGLCFFMKINNVSGFFQMGLSSAVIKDYKEGDNFSDVSKWGSIFFQYLDRTKNYRIVYETSPAYETTKIIQYLFSDNNQPPDISYINPPNPYEPGGDSEEGGGGGTFDDDSDPIPDSSLPTISSANTGFTRIYNPTLTQVQDLARYLWTDETVIQTIWNHIKQYFEDPMQAIIGFNLVPCAVPNGGTKNFALMYIDTGVQMTVAANQFVDVDCGTLELKEYFGSALDYSPYTKIACFLPFIGTVQLNTDEVMKNTLQVKYRIDVCSGSCVAKILVSGNVLYQYSGHCAIPIPLSSADFSSYVSAAVSVAKLAIGAAVGGGMGALMAGADNPTQQTNQVVTTTQTTETGRNPVTGRQITLGTRTTVETRESPSDQSSTQASFSGLSPTNIANTVGQIMTAKPYVEHSGSFSGNTGYLGVRRPYLIIQRPNMCMPNQYQSFNGFPSMITEEFSSLKGFTRIQQVQLTGMSATNPEQAEILEFLKSGVII